LSKNRVIYEIYEQKRVKMGGKEEDWLASLGKGKNEGKKI